MSITSLIFIGFIFLTLLIYYAVPGKLQWLVLLAASLLFYILSSPWGIFFVLITSASVYGATRWMEALTHRQKEYLRLNKGSLTKEEKKAYKETVRSKRKWIMTGTLILNFGILCVFKYSHFALEQVNGALSLFGCRTITDNINLPLVLGISFYTFQSMGYLIDVYWETAEVQHNYAKTLLFVSFFPQVTQGPISDYTQLSGELFSEHRFSYENYSRGLQRMIWGFFKKMVIADYLAPLVNDAFANYSGYIGLACLMAAFGYSIQIYADFSGYMDIMCGTCELFGIRLSENFIRPYFSKSVAEYWRRWHITLGEWFKKYIYYPIAVSKWNRNLGKKLTTKFGKTVGKNIPATIALLVVWMTTGLWHGASWAYVAWGLVNGLFIIFSMWMEPVYDRMKSGLRVKENSFGWRAFQTVRTYILVTFIKVLPEVGTLKDGAGLLFRAVTDYSRPTCFKDVFPAVTDKVGFLVVAISVVALFLTSLLQRKQPIRDYFNKRHVIIRFAVLLVLVLLIFSFGVGNSLSEGFMYAQF